MQNKIGGQNSGNFDRIAKFAISSQTVRKVANFAMQLRISQCSCEIGKAVANFANHIAKFAMRNFAKDFDVFVRQMNSAIVVCEFRNANFALPNSQCQIRNAKWLPTDCQLFAKIPVLLFFSSDFQYILQNLHKTSKIKARKIAEE